MTKKENKPQVDRSLYNNKDFVYAYGWNHMMMRVIGGWSEDDDSFFVKSVIIVNISCLILFVSLPQLGSMTVFWGDLDAVIECLCINLAVNLSLLKLFWLRSQQSTVRNLIKFMAKDWLMEKTTDEQEEMMKMAKVIRLISSLSFYGTVCLFSAYVSAQILLAYQLRNEPSIDSRLAKGFLYTCVFPFDTSSPVIFTPIWICQFYMTYVSMTGYSSPDSFLVMFVFHQCGQLKALRRRLENIVDDETVKNPRKFWRKLTSIVERHECLNERTAEIEDNFNKIFLAVTMWSIFTTCTQGFATITALRETEEDVSILQIIFLVVFSTYDLVHFFVYCLAGDILMTESSNFGVSLYNSQWYNLAPSEAKAVLIFTSRCTIPQKITAGKFCMLSLPLFTAIFKTSASYLSVLLAMK